MTLKFEEGQPDLDKISMSSTQRHVKDKALASNTSEKMDLFTFVSKHDTAAVTLKFYCGQPNLFAGRHFFDALLRQTWNATCFGTALLVDKEFIATYPLTSNSHAFFVCF